MNKTLLLVLCVFAMLALSGCTVVNTASSARINSVVEAGDHYQIETGIVSVEPGETASLLVYPDQNYTVTATDYRGEYRITRFDSGLTRIDLLNVQYPTRVQLTLSHDSRTIRYAANGGFALTPDGTEITVQYDVTVHTRPNVSIGTDLFVHDGYTLTGWNTKPDGSGISVGLGSRMTVDDSAVLYAQWAEWTPEDQFTYRLLGDNAVITACTSADSTIAVPETLDGYTVINISPFAFAGNPADTVILPKTIQRVASNAFDGAALSTISFFDNIDYITDESFSNCPNLSTIRISAIDDPYGYAFRRESVWADKLDLLISTMGQKRIIFYGGCSMWYNLIGSMAQQAFGDQYTIINMGLNGVSSSIIQMELLRCFVTENDILFHTPEISSTQQLLTTTNLSRHDDKLCCALEYDYDLLSLVDIRAFGGGVLESLRLYLDKKQPGGRYTDEYRDSQGYAFWDETGSLPFIRTETSESLADQVELDPAYLADLSRLAQEYALLTDKGVKLYVSYACVNIDQVPDTQKRNVLMMDNLFRDTFSRMKDVTVIGHLQDFLFHDADCYDTVYHLLTEPAKRCTETWLRGLKEAMTADGLWLE